VLADAGLDGGLLVGADDVLIGPQRRLVEAAGVEVSTRAALGPKSGSRGKIQDRCCQGLIASALSQRQMVVPEIEATMPDSTAARARSGHCQRASGWGLLAFAGNSQASA
jgi:IMP dehydrogenase/GMP reductase